VPPAPGKSGAGALPWPGLRPGHGLGEAGLTPGAWYEGGRANARRMESGGPG